MASAAYWQQQGTSAAADVLAVVAAVQTKVNGEKDVDDIRTLMEEVDMRIKETKQETYEFKRDVILGEWFWNSHCYPTAHRLYVHPGHTPFHKLNPTQDRLLFVNSKGPSTPRRPYRRVTLHSFRTRSCSRLVQLLQQPYQQRTASRTDLCS